jgi:hypothetical protein
MDEHSALHQHFGRKSDCELLRGRQLDLWQLNTSLEVAKYVREEAKRSE